MGTLAHVCFANGISAIMVWNGGGFPFCVSNKNILIDGSVNRVHRAVSGPAHFIKFRLFSRGNADLPLSQ